MIRKHTISLKHAIDGLRWALSTQPNYRVHIILAFLSLLASWYFRISYTELLVILVLIMVGLVIETLNTSIEATTDAIDENIREDIKIAKDTAAAGMLIYAIGSSVIAAVIFLPRILLLLGVE